MRLKVYGLQQDLLLQRLRFLFHNFCNFSFSIELTLVNQGKFPIGYLRSLIADFSFELSISIYLPLIILKHLLA